MNIKRAYNHAKARIKLVRRKWPAKKIDRAYASLWRHAYWAQYHFKVWQAKWGQLIICATLAEYLWLSFCIAPYFQSKLEPHFSNNLAELKTLLVTLGGALIGGDVIAFSFVMFAMQVNFERLPFGLFRKFSADARLISAFGCTFLFAIVVACTSLIPDKAWIATAILIAVWGIILTVGLFVYCYHRALLLVNPAQQIKLLTKDAKKQMKSWGKSADRAAPLFNITGDEPFAATHDLARASYFKANHYWTAGVLTVVQYAVSFSRRYAERGDHEVSNIALNAIPIINQSYVAIKGKTFFSNPAMIDNPLATDRFINDTLEHLRQNVQIAIARKDEQQIEQTLRVLAALVKIYIQIDYGEQFASKTHAHLAAYYLAEGVKVVVPLNMPDVVTEGIRLMGGSADQFLAVAQPTDITTLADSIGILGAACAAVEQYRAVTLEAVRQLARLTFNLIKTGSGDITFAAKQLKGNMLLIAKILLAMQDTPIPTVHNTYLAPYYSSTAFDGLLTWLTGIVNAVGQAETDNVNAKRIIRNIEDWSEELYQAEKELLLMAVEKRSQFTFDIIHWITHITKLLLALSNASACEDHFQEKLRDHAIWLISTLSWVPDNREAVLFVNNFQMTEQLFEVALDAHQRGCTDVGDEVEKLLFDWAFKAGKHQASGTILEKSIYGLATLSLLPGSLTTPEILKLRVTESLAQTDAVIQEIRDRAARSIREEIASLRRRGFAYSHIEMAMGEADPTRLRDLLNELANLLSPDTANERVRHHTAFGAPR